MINVVVHRLCTYRTVLLMSAAEGAPYTFATIGCSFEDGNCITEYNILGNETHYVIVAVRERGKRYEEERKC